MPETQQTIQLPVLAPPVDRHADNVAAIADGPGVVAAQSKCSNLHGMAQQMCYAAEYGVTV